jgi:hypothetical protein
MIKRTDAVGGWLLLDDKRDTTNPRELFLSPNTSQAEFPVTNGADFLENGFTMQSTNGSLNANGGKYIYMAFAADPTTIEPSLEDSFNTVAYTGQSVPYPVEVGFTPDLIWVKSRTNSYNHGLFDTLRPNGRYLKSNTTDAQSASSDTALHTLTDTGFTWTETAGSFNSSGNYVAWCWKGAELPAINSNGSITSVVSANPAAGFSIVSYTGSVSQTGTVGHGLDIAPNVIFVKNRDNAYNWVCYFSELGASDYLSLNETYASSFPDSRPWNDTSPTSSVFTASNGSFIPVNENGSGFIAYCFAEVAGFSKFGSHTTAAAKITTGFEPAWVMIKYTGATSDWWIMDLARWDGTSYGSNGGKLIKPYLEANTSDAEGSVGSGSIEVMSDGFYPTNFFNAGGAIHMAFANQF